MDQYGYQGGQSAFGKCPCCGNAVEPEAAFCPHCGRPVAAYNQPDPWSGIPYGVSKGDFRRQYAPPEQQKSITVVSIIGYVLCGINVLVALLNPFALIDVAVFLGLTLGIHLGKSKGCAIAMLVYGIVGCVIGLLAAGTPSGWAWIVLGAVAMSSIGKMDAVYEQFRAANPY